MPSMEEAKLISMSDDCNAKSPTEPAEFYLNLSAGACIFKVG